MLDLPVLGSPMNMFTLLHSSSSSLIDLKFSIVSLLIKPLSVNRRFDLNLCRIKAVKNRTSEDDEKIEMILILMFI